MQLFGARRHMFVPHSFLLPAIYRRFSSPFDLHVTSWVSDSDMDVFGQFLRMGAWPITRHHLPLLDVFPAQEARACGTAL